MLKTKTMTLRLDEETHSQFESIRLKVKDEFGIDMNNSELIRYIINQLARGIKQ